MPAPSFLKSMLKRQPVGRVQPVFNPENAPRNTQVGLDVVLGESPGIPTASARRGIQNVIGCAL
jgi:hypothetical protein